MEFLTFILCILVNTLTVTVLLLSYRFNSFRDFIIGKLDGCALLSPDQIEKLKASMASSWRSDPRPFESYQLTNNNAEIRRVKILFTSNPLFFNI